MPYTLNIFKNIHYTFQWKLLGFNIFEIFYEYLFGKIYYLIFFF